MLILTLRLLSYVVGFFVVVVLIPGHSGQATVADINGR